MKTLEETENAFNPSSGQIPFGSLVKLTLRKGIEVTYVKSLHGYGKDGMLIYQPLSGRKPSRQHSITSTYMHYAGDILACFLQSSLLQFKTLRNGQEHIFSIKTSDIADYKIIKQSRDNI